MKTKILLTIAAFAFATTLTNAADKPASVRQGVNRISALVTTFQKYVAEKTHPVVLKPEHRDKDNRSKIEVDTVPPIVRPCM